MYYKIKKWYKDNKVFINLENPKQKKHFQQLIAPFNINKTIQHIYYQYIANHMPILYSIDINFDITIPDFASITNINNTSNHIKAWNKADKKGTNNNGWDGAGNNSEDNDNGEDISGVRI